MRATAWAHWTVWGADAERVCVPEKYAVKVPEDLGPGGGRVPRLPVHDRLPDVHRTARVHAGETMLVHGAAGRVGTAALELGALAELRMFGTCSARDTAAVERLGAAAIDYRNDFLARVRELTGGEGVDVVLDGIGGKVALRSFRALRKGNSITGDPGGRLVTMGAYNTLAQGRKSMRVVRVVAGDGDHLALGHARPAGGSRATGSRSCASCTRTGSPRTSRCCCSCYEGKVHPVVAERLPFQEARRAHEMLETSAAKGKLVLVP